jgi:amino acid adenylation domain-containing protein
MTQLAGTPAVLELPTDHPRPAVPSLRGGSLPLMLSKELSAALADLGRRRGATLYMVALAAFQLLLSRWSGQRDVVVGSPIAGRTHRETEGLIGLFVNTLILRADVSDDPSFCALLDRVKEAALGAYEHQDVPFEQLLEQFQPQRDLSRHPVFQVMFALQNLPQEELEIIDLRLKPVEQAMASAKFDLSLELTERPDGIVGNMEYATDLFDQATIERLAAGYRTLLEGIVAEPDRRVSELPLLPVLERHRLLVEWNATDAEYPQQMCIHELFEAQVERTPDAVAVVHEDRELSYRELNARANRLAHHLRGLGVKPDDRVAICVERSAEMVVGLLAVLKAGGCYVPLDPSYPAERLGYMLSDSAPVAVLTQAGLRDALRSGLSDIPVVELDDDAPWLAEPESNPDPADVGLRSSHLAYVIYTSGSTGTPQGVMVGHQNLVHEIEGLRIRYGLSGQDRVLQFASIAFDMSVEEIFAALLSGAGLVLRTDEWLSGVRAFYERCDRHGVSVVNLPPVFWQRLVREDGIEIPDTLRQVMIGGEAASSSAMAAWFRRGGHRPRLINAYGPTEATVNATLHELQADTCDRQIIGRPISNARIYILDGRGEPVPIGVSGEIHIGGAGVARGYLNRPELTSERFIASPFVAGERLYRTRDLGRYHADGTIEYLGRNDQQVKIRGFRIELGEIEARLSSYPGVGEGVVVAREDAAGEKRLVGYYTLADAASGRALEVDDLRRHLALTLPDYMVPAAYVHLGALPLTPNGKMDRKSLPAPAEDSFARRDYETPLGELEVMLAFIWSAVLSQERVGRHDNFFDLGGNSLLAMSLLDALSQRNFSVTIRTLFENPDIASLAKCILEGSVIPIRSTGTQSPLFFIHELASLDYQFSELSRHIDPDIPIYGLPALPLSAFKSQTMDGIAMRLLAIIRSIQPVGPYRLAGWSFGGLVAYEIAIQLLGRDQIVEFIGLLNSHCPTASNRVETSRVKNAQQHRLLKICESKAVEKIVSALGADVENMAFDKLFAKCREEDALPWYLSNTTASVARKYISRMVAHEHAIGNYSIYPISAQVHLFSTVDKSVANEMARGKAGDMMGWSAVLSPRQIQSIEVPGNHSSMIDERVGALGQAINWALQQSKRRQLASAETRYRPVRTVRAGRPDREPVFCVPGAGNDLIGLADLASALDEIWPMHELQLRGADCALVPHSTVEAAAAAYIREIDAMYPTDRIHLLGHAFGGWIAFEIASQLSSAGRQVASLTLIASDAPGGGLFGQTYTAADVVLQLVKQLELPPVNH